MSKIVKSFSYTLVSNVIAFTISALVTFIVPKVLGAENYGYLQLYLFYFNYTGFLHFGWADGIYLRYGGEYYEELDKKVFSGQFRAYFILEIFLSVLIAIGSIALAPTQDKQIVYCFVAISIPLHLPKTFLQYVLQGTNRIKEYATITMIDRGIYIFLIVLLVVFRNEEYEKIIIADLVGKTVALLYAVYQCRDIVSEKACRLNEAIKEAKLNISVGIKMMFANIASMLIVGIVRASIENQWDVATFGKVSLTMSVSNMLMVCIRAVATIMFPLLRRVDSKKYSEIYTLLRSCIIPLLLGMLVLYYPMKVVMSVWLPQYEDSMMYMALLFPICVFESKMSMLIETYMKALRKEKLLLAINAVTVLMSVILTEICAYGIHNLDLTVASILFLLMFRCVFSEILLSNVIKINVKKDIILEIALTGIFVGASWYVQGVKGLILYGCSFLIYLIIKYKDIKMLLSLIKNLWYVKKAQI